MCWVKRSTWWLWESCAFGRSVALDLWVAYHLFPTLPNDHFLQNCPLIQLPCRYPCPLNSLHHHLILLLNCHRARQAGISSPKPWLFPRYQAWLLLNWWRACGRKNNLLGEICAEISQRGCCSKWCSAIGMIHPKFHHRRLLQEYLHYLDLISPLLSLNQPAPNLHPQPPSQLTPPPKLLE